jgi:hypothetical protein
MLTGTIITALMPSWPLASFLVMEVRLEVEDGIFIPLVACCVSWLKCPQYFSTLEELNSIMKKQNSTEGWLSVFEPW